MLILLSPAKSLDYESPIALRDFTLPYFSAETAELAAVLKKNTVSDLEQLMKISKKLAELNYQRFQNFSAKLDVKNLRPQNLRPQNLRQAVLAFDGDVYATLAAKKFSAVDFAFAQKHLRILSGFYGVLKPLDLMQPYRLEMGTNLQVKRLKNLYQFWEDKISKYLDLECKNSGFGHMINLASEEYFLAVNPQKISAKIINVVFKEKKNGAYKIIGINAKKARGLMANFIIKNAVTKPQDLKKFTSEKYFFAAELSDAANFVFVRE